jgi:hypothetical protein
VKFFKHYCDARNGITMNAIFEADGHRGVSCYWMLVEMCAERMNKKRDEEWSEDDCVFKIHDRELRSNLRVTRTTAASILRLYGTMAALRAELIGSVWHIEFPKLLEILNRDAKRTRPGRATDAGNKKKKKEEKERERDCVRASAPLPHLSLRWNSLKGVIPITELDVRGYTRVAELEATRSSEEWDALFARVQASTFLIYKARATFLWVIEPANAKKIESGKYDDPDYAPPKGGIDWDAFWKRQDERGEN